MSTNPCFRDHFIHPQQSLRHLRNRRILFGDSGCGGLSVVAGCKRLLLDERFTLIADNAGHPYGENKTIEQVGEHISRACREHLEARIFKCLVVACNTASHPSILARLNWEYGLPVFGMIEPTARALLMNEARRRVPGPGRCRRLRIGIMGTQLLLRSETYQEALWRHARQLGLAAPEIVEVPCVGLATAIDHGSDQEKSSLAATVERCLRPVMSGLPDVLLLGCTHFCVPDARDAIAKVVGRQVTLYDPAQAVAEEVWRWANAGDRGSDLPAQPRPVVKTTKPDPSLTKRMSDLWDMMCGEEAA